MSMKKLAWFFYGCLLSTFPLQVFFAGKEMLGFYKLDNIFVHCPLWWNMMWVLIAIASVWCLSWKKYKIQDVWRYYIRERN